MINTVSRTVGTPMSMKPHRTALIIGAGIAGLADVLMITNGSDGVTATLADGSGSEPTCWSPPTACTPRPGR
jgi:hypothetical protein